MQGFRQLLSGFDASFETIEVRTLGEIVSEAMVNIRLTLQLLGCFAILGVVVAGLGVYATTMLMAVSQNREMGIRMALGAQSADILRLAFWRGIRVIFIGLPFGLLMAWIMSKVLSNFLVQVKVGDALVWVLCCVLLTGIATVATLIPALRATRVNPLDALRNE